MHFVYFIRSLKNKNWVYVGSTSNLAKRIKSHNKGEVRSTKHHKPFELIYHEMYVKLSDARKRERQIKTSRSKKEDILKSLKINTALSSNG